MKTQYHIGHLVDHFDSNIKNGMISLHLNGIFANYEKGLIKVSIGNEKAFKKIIKRMYKYNEGYWEKENLEYKILYYALIGIIIDHD